MADAKVVLKNDKQIMNAIKRLGDRLPDAAFKAMRLGSFLIQGHIQERKLSGQVLRVRTGRLRSSVTNKVKRIGKTSVVGVIGTNVVYARAHEFGVPERGLRARPYLRPAFRESQAKVKELFRRTLSDFAKGTVRGAG